MQSFEKRERYSVYNSIVVVFLTIVRLKYWYYSICTVLKRPDVVEKHIANFWAILINSRILNFEQNAFYNWIYYVSIIWIIRSLTSLHELAISLLFWARGNVISECHLWLLYGFMVTLVCILSLITWIPKLSNKVGISGSHTNQHAELLGPLLSL